MGLIFGPKRTFSTGTEWGLTTDGDIIWRGFSSGTDIKVDILKGQGFALSSTVTVDTNANNNDVMLNEPFCRDPVTGRLHLCFGRSIDSGSAAVLMHSSSNDGAATWDAAPHTLDDGTVHSGNNKFYRVGIAAYNGYVTVWYTYEDNSVFTTDGLWEVHSFDAGQTWTAPAKPFSSPVGPYEPNVALGEDGTMHVSWYDPGVVSNVGGAVYYARGRYTGFGWTWEAPRLVAPLSETWGRTRIFCSNGVVAIVGNINWGGSVADVGYIRSGDNGDTWSATATLATHGSGPLGHPWGVIDCEKAAIMWTDNSTSPMSYGLILSTDAGKTWGSPIVPYTTTGTSDAPRLVMTNDLLTAWGNDDVAGNAMKAAYPWFAPDPATTASIDAFNRADENPLSDGSKWTKSTDAGNNAKLVGNQVTRQLGAGSFDRSGNYRNDVTTSGGAWEIYLDIVTAGGEINLIIWDTSTNGYNFVMQSDDFGTNAGLNKKVAGANTVLDNYAFGAMAAGDRIVLRLDQNDIVGMLYRSGDWREIIRATDTAFRNGLNQAFDIAGNAGTPVIDNFGGGQLLAPVNSTLPVITGAVAPGQMLTASYGTWATDLGKTPARYRFQWQLSTDGGSTWADIPRATLRFLKLDVPYGQYRVKVTAYNSIGSTLATSGAVVPPQQTFRQFPSRFRRAVAVR